ncbi:LysM peptidoglycan-binding domain-containing protein [Carnobacteriaceae bacterium zg-ZUI240]|nr:LysM peptidoglycan-binding domain-containing protein [Carnobacteriaceae bacterium zg-ZUI240]
MKKVKLTVGIVLVLVGAMLWMVTKPTVFAQGLRDWSPRSVEEIKTDLLNNAKNGSSSYTVKWGDTLYALSKATNISMEHLASINAISNFSLIDENAILSFNKDRNVVSVSDGLTVNSFDAKSGEKVNVSKEEKTQQTIQTQQHKPSDETSRASASSVVETTTQAATATQQKAPAQSQATPAVAKTQEVVATSRSPKLYTLNRFMFLGVINWNSLKFTYYSQSVLPGGGLRIPGRHVNADGYVADKDGYIVLASSAPLGTIIDTPFGYQGKVYDRGTYGNHYDVYVR